MSSLTCLDTEVLKHADKRTGAYVMGWLAWSDNEDCRAAHSSVTPQSYVANGALVLEAYLPSDSCVETLFEVSCLHPTPTLMRIQSIPGEGISIFLKSGTAVFHTVLSHAVHARTDSIRLTFNWDATEGDGLIAVEYPGEDSLFTRELAGCIAMPGALILSALAEMHDPETSQKISYIAFHKGPILVGPSPTLVHDTPLLTPQGYRAIGTLKPGDTVVSATGDIVPVLGIFKKVTPAFASNAPVRLRAPYFGLQTDLVMAGTQRIIASGSDVEYSFGCDKVLIPARHLIDGTTAIAQPADGAMTYFQVLLPENEAVIASGLHLESLFISRLRRRKDIFKYTTLCTAPRNRLPEHAANATKVLGPFEAVSLAAMRAA